MEMHSKKGGKGGGPQPSTPATLDFSVEPDGEGGFVAKYVINLNGANMGKLKSWSMDIVSMYSQNPVVDGTGTPVQNTGGITFNEVAGSGNPVMEHHVTAAQCAAWGDLVGICGDVYYQKDFISVAPINRQWFYRETGQPFTG